VTNTRFDFGRFIRTLRISSIRKQSAGITAFRTSTVYSCGRIGLAYLLISHSSEADPMLKQMCGLRWIFFLDLRTDSGSCSSNLYMDSKCWDPQTSVAGAHWRQSLSMWDKFSVHGVLLLQCNGGMDMGISFRRPTIFSHSQRGFPFVFGQNFTESRSFRIIYEIYLQFAISQVETPLSATYPSTVWCNTCGVY